MKIESIIAYAKSNRKLEFGLPDDPTEDHWARIVDELSPPLWAFFGTVAPVSSSGMVYEADTLHTLTMPHLVSVGGLESDFSNPMVFANAGIESAETTVTVTMNQSFSMRQFKLIRCWERWLPISRR